MKQLQLFKDGKKDVLIATDIAAKGLDFPDIQHVINFDMPAEIENYVHRIGCTGRCGKTGVATTFINKGVPESALLDLKHLLIEAHQAMPPALNMIVDVNADLQASHSCLQHFCWQLLCVGSITYSRNYDTVCEAGWMLVAVLMSHTMTTQLLTHAALLYYCCYACFYVAVYCQITGDEWCEGLCILWWSWPSYHRVP
eukprot:17845-Heterococcus_DN1.PRE.4